MTDEAAKPAHAANPLEGFEFSADGDGVRLGVCAPSARFSLRMDGGDLPKAEKIFGQAVPLRVGEMSVSGPRLALCLGPDEWMLLMPTKAAGGFVAGFKRLETTLMHALVDICDRQVGIEITGQSAALLLNAGCPLDLEEMGTERCSRSVIEGVQVLVMKFSSEHYRIEIARSYAEFIREFLVQAAADG